MVFQARESWEIFLKLVWFHKGLTESDTWLVTLRDSNPNRSHARKADVFERGVRVRIVCFMTVSMHGELGDCRKVISKEFVEGWFFMFLCFMVLDYVEIVTWVSPFCLHTLVTQ